MSSKKDDSTRPATMPPDSQFDSEFTAMPPVAGPEFGNHRLLIRRGESMPQFKPYLLAVGLAAAFPAQAQTPGSNGCEISKPIPTPAGLTSKSECSTTGPGHRHTLFLDGEPVLSDTALFKEDHDAKRSTWIYTSGTSDPRTACASRLYLLDVSAKPAKVIAFGVKAACNEFQRADWGDKRSVIVLKNDVKFVYENGKMTSPLTGPRLLRDVEPSHGGSLASTDAVAPFVEDISPAKR